MSIAEIIKNIESHSFSNKQIELLVRDPSIRVVDYQIFDQIADLDEVLEDRLDAIIFLMQQKENAAGHWVSLIVNKDEMLLEFFDSYGLGLRGNLAIAHSDSDNLLKLINEKMAQGYDYQENRTPLQTLSNRVNTCGIHVSLRVIFKHLYNEEYISMIKKWAKNHKMSTDEAVISLMTTDVIRVLRLLE